MSYNVDTWKTKKLKDLRIPVEAFFTNPRADWHPDKKWDEDNFLTLVGGCDSCLIRGKVVDGIINVAEIDCSGEGSGTYLNWIVEPALKQSKGILEAVRVWEGGDSIDKLTAIDGEVSTESVDL